MQRAFGRYRLVRHLASGGMGEVWLAEAAGAAGFSKRVVIKTLRPELTADPRLIEQFVAEGQLLEQLDHPNIAQILDLGHADDTWFLAMEYVEGFDLRALLRAGTPDGVGEVPALCLLAAAARALEHAASRRGSDGKPLAIVHHDVTPSNLMVRRDGHVKLVDFGVARSAMRAHLEPGALRGKLPYLAPEQVRAPDRVDARADLFALGLVAVELLTGQRAMNVADPAGLEVAWGLLPDRVARLCADVDAATVALVMRLTALEPSDRPDSAAETHEAIRTRLAALSVSDIERPIAGCMDGAFARLEAEAGGFSQTLGALVAAGSRTPDQATGTVSLPGLADFGQTVAPSQFGQAAPDLAAFSPSERPTPAAEAPSTSAASSTPTSDLLLGGASTVTTATASAPGDAAEGMEITTSPVLGLPADSVLAAAKGRPAGPLGLKRRVWFALLLLLAVATTLGWWLGGRDPVGVAASPPVTTAVGRVASLAGADRDTGVTQAALRADDASTAAQSNDAPSNGTGLSDAGIPDAGIPDAGIPDAGIPDAGIPDAGVHDGALDVPQDRSDARVASAGADARSRPDVRPVRRVAASRRAKAGTVAAAKKPDVRPAGRRAVPSSKVDKRRGNRGQLIFRVLPVDAEVRIDGRPMLKRPANGVYRLTLSAGSHRLQVRDPTSGKTQRRVERVVAGVERRVGGFTLVPTLP